MNTCFEGETWFCNPQDIVGPLLRLLHDAQVSERGGCTILEHPRLRAKVCPLPRGRLGSIEYAVCRVLIVADPSLCGHIKILLMRGGG